MARKKIQSSHPKGEITDPKLDVKKTEDVDDIAEKIGKLTYGQCLVLKIALDRRISATRARKN